MSRAGSLGHLVERTAGGRRSVQRFVAGDTIAAAVASAEEMKQRGFLVTLDRLGEVSGAIPPDDVLGRLFSSFCIGK